MNSEFFSVALLSLAAAGYSLSAPEPASVKTPEERVSTRTPKTEKTAKVPDKRKADAAPEEKPAATPGKPKLAPAGSARVADVLATLPLVNEETVPNAKARYFIYLMSASWCGPCNQEMPHIVEAYKEIRREGVAEIILIDFDSNQENARAYMNKYGATFPAIMQDKAPALPGIQPPGGIPSAIIVDDRGNMVAKGHGSITTQWKERISEYEKQNGIRSSEKKAVKSAPKSAGKTKSDTGNKKKKKSNNSRRSAKG